MLAGMTVGFTIPQMTRGVLLWEEHRTIDDPGAPVGQYSDLAGDAGGPTRFSITLATLTLWRHIHGQPTPTAEDVRNLTIAEASLILASKFFLGAHLERLPLADDGLYSRLAFELYGINVGSGPAEGVDILQHVLIERGHSIGGVDGQYGEKTAAATLAEWTADPDDLVNAVIDRCYVFYQGVYIRYPATKRFDTGWRWRLKQLRVGPPRPSSPRSA